MDMLEKNLLILASAGSGKTYQLVNRVIGLVARGTAPERIVALTFTRKAAGEFADAVVNRLAAAAVDEAAAARLRDELRLPGADFGAALERVVRALHVFTLGTMDGFFARIVRGFQYELGLTGGRFDLLEGPRALAAQEEMLGEILGDMAAAEQADGFYHAFRRATIGREDQRVRRPLKDFVDKWQEIHRENRDIEWGPAFLLRVAPEDWSRHKGRLAGEVRAGLDHIHYTHKKQRAALEDAVRTLETHVIGSGSLGNAKTLLQSIMNAVAGTDGPLLLSHYKPFEIIGPEADALRGMVRLAAACEMASAVLRTRAVRDVVAVYDGLCGRRLRAMGMLGFGDIKMLMGEWARGEDARLRREAVDFRLDARTDHWLLDEFQDTSHADWAGLMPLVDEAASDDSKTIFIVGDSKQAIYGWRGGDVRLFSGVVARYRRDGAPVSLVESFRSSPEVLELVNRVCGDKDLMHGLFGEAADDWEWGDHVSASHLSVPEKRGEARVEVVGPWEERLDRLEEILRELGVGNRNLTCGVLLRGNEKVRQVADDLRARGFDVIEEGKRLPAEDNPVGVAVRHLLKWLADPADAFARRVVEMSPFAALLHGRYGGSWDALWEGLTNEVSCAGYASTLGGMMEELRGAWSDFGRRRAGDLLAALADLDQRGVVSPAEAADWIARLEVAQSPGSAAVQVMTIHKAKGLGFDVVILPDIPEKELPESQYFTLAEGDGWISSPPPKWARELIPEMRDAEQAWAVRQRYEGFCILYVALTRAKRGLYVLLDTPPAKPNPGKPSLQNWLACAVGAETKTGVVFQAGAPGWADGIGAIPDVPPAAEAPGLGTAVRRPGRVSPSATKARAGGAAVVHSPAGMRFGSEVHALLETVEWTDGGLPPMPAGDAGMLVSGLLRNPALKDIFERGDRDIELFREQAVDAFLDGALLSGVIDRLHVHRDGRGVVECVRIIDYKTDAVDAPGELAERYSGQMAAYRAALSRIHPGARVECLLLSVRHGVLVPA